MIVYTDSIRYSNRIITKKSNWEIEKKPYSFSESSLIKLLETIFKHKTVYKTECDSYGIFEYMLMTEYTGSSHYDLLKKLSKENAELPDGIICLADSSHRFHGQRDRSWVALPGNLHLSIYLAPNCQVKNIGASFLTLAAVSVIETVNSFQDIKGRASIKWVNDILVDGAKLAGFLAHTRSTNDRVSSAILGIGMNVQKTPVIHPDRFIQKAVSLSSLVSESSECNQKIVLDRLLKRLNENYHKIKKGQPRELVALYREYSNVIGKKVTILSDYENEESVEIASGTVVRIGENLELYLDDNESPITSGRLVFKS